MDRDGPDRKSLGQKQKRELGRGGEREGRRVRGWGGGGGGGEIAARERKRQVEQAEEALILLMVAICIRWS